jgi:hypothetical protein
MKTSEIKLDLFRKIDSLEDAELERLYDKLLALLNTPALYPLSKGEKAAIDEALEASEREETYVHGKIKDEARTKYPNLRFK